MTAIRVTYNKGHNKVYMPTEPRINKQQVPQPIYPNIGMGTCAKEWYGCFYMLSKSLKSYYWGVPEKHKIKQREKAQQGSMQLPCQINVDNMQSMDGEIYM